MEVLEERRYKLFCSIIEVLVNRVHQLTTATSCGRPSETKTISFAFSSAVATIFFTSVPLAGNIYPNSWDLLCLCPPSHGLTGNKSELTFFPLY